MSKLNRKREYERLKKLGKLSQDDGALEKEFGQKELPKLPEKKLELKKGKK